MCELYVSYIHILSWLDFYVRSSIVHNRKESTCLGQVNQKYVASEKVFKFACPLCCDNKFQAFFPSFMVTQRGRHRERGEHTAQVHLSKHWGGQRHIASCPVPGRLGLQRRTKLYVDCWTQDAHSEART